MGSAIYIGRSDVPHVDVVERTVLTLRFYLNQGDEGPVIAKRVVEDRSASAEGPAPAEHCIVVKQAPGGGGAYCSARRAALLDTYAPLKGLFARFGTCPTCALQSSRSPCTAATILDATANA